MNYVFRNQYDQQNTQANPFNLYSFLLICSLDLSISSILLLLQRQTNCKRDENDRNR